MNIKNQIVIVRNTIRTGSASFFETSDTTIMGGAVIMGSWMNDRTTDGVSVSDCGPSTREAFDNCVRMEVREAAEKAERDATRVSEVVQSVEEAQKEFADTIVLSVAFRGGISNTKALTAAEIAMIQLDPSIDKAKFRGSKTLFTCKEYNAIGSFTSGAHARFAEAGIPFPLRRGMHLVNIRLIPKVEEMVKEIEAELSEVVAKFIAVDPSVIVEDLVKLGPLYNKADYKPVGTIASSFSFSSRWMHFGTPESLKLISNEFFLKEQQRTADIWKEAKEQGLVLLRQEVSGMVDRLVDSLTAKDDGSKKKFYASAVTNITDFISVFDDRNIAGDADLAEQVERMKSLVSNVDPAALSKDFDLRGKVKQSMEQVKAKLDTMIVSSTARAITFED